MDWFTALVLAFWLKLHGYCIKHAYSGRAGCWFCHNEKLLKAHERRERKQASKAALRSRRHEVVKELHHKFYGAKENA